MNINAQRVKRVAAITVVSYFIAYTVHCWLLDFAFPRKLARRSRHR